MSFSILTNDFYHCYLCGRRAQCKHHIYPGSRRRNSELNGFLVPLCDNCHNMSDEAVHFDREKDLNLKRECQKKYEETHTRGEFLKLIGRNYLG